MSNSIDTGDVAGVLAGYRAGTISYDVAKNLLRKYGTGDSFIDEMLSIGAGIGVGMLVGGAVDGLIDGLFGD